MLCSGCGRTLPDESPCSHCQPTIYDGKNSRKPGATPDSLLPTALLPVPTGRLREPTSTGRFVPGTLFAGRYRIVHAVGMGGMGEVYRAEDLRLGQTIALKFVFESQRGDPWAFERFRDEARMARKVSHTHVCRIYDFGEVDGLAYVTMEFMEGGDLKGLRGRVGRMAPERALEIALEICQGLAAIHEQGILHRDLKPANVMLDDKGKVRILDFGLAAMADGVAGADVQSGTPAYMAPEQAAGLGVTVQSDLYSLGLVLYELWTGERLGPEDREDPPPISSKVGDVDPAIDRIVLRCLKPEPKGRPASVEAVAAGLRKAGVAEAGPSMRTVMVTDPPCPRPEVDGAFDELLEAHGGRLAWDRRGPLLVFDHPGSALGFSLARRQQAAEVSKSGRFAIELTLVRLRHRRASDPGEGGAIAEGEVATLARSMIELALPGQTLLGGHAYRMARRSGRPIDGAEELTWLSHGRYRLSGLDEPVEVFEVGSEEHSPLIAPPSSAQADPPLDRGRFTGWRPAPGARIPQRPSFELVRRVGEGGFGEAWLASHRKTRERRVLKFCFDEDRLGSLQREVALFRLLEGELGERPDIARVLDWNLDQAPYFVESEYTAGGDLEDWAEVVGGIGLVPLEERLELVAQVADALAAAHSAGVLHKDVKPSNILVAFAPKGGSHARLADFGVGAAMDEKRLEAAGHTVADWARAESGSGSGSASGTRLYQAPEVLEGRMPTTAADIYSLGVVLYQVVIGRFGRAVAPGWRESIEDPLLLEDIASTLHWDPDRRLGSARELAERLRSLDARRAAAAAEEQRRQKEAERERMLLEAEARRERYRWGATVGLAVFLAMALLTTWAIDARMAEAEARLEAEAVKDFLLQVFEIEDPLWIGRVGLPAPEQAAVELLERGGERLDTAFVEAPEIRADLLHRLGAVFRYLGKFERAKAMAEEALEIRLEIFGEEHLGVAEALDSIGITGIESDPAGSEILFRRAFEIRKKLLPPYHPDTLRTLDHLTLCLMFQGSFGEAETILRGVLEARRRLGGSNRLEFAASLQFFALLHDFSGRPDEALDLYDRALEAFEQISEGDSRPLADTLHLKATLLASEGRTELAEALFRRSLAMNQRLGRGQHASSAIPRYRLADVLIARGELEEAERLLGEAFEVLGEVYPEEHWRLADARGVEAMLLIERGRFEEAESSLLRDRAFLESSKNVMGVPLLSAQSRRLCSLYRAWDEPIRAEAYCAL